MNRRAFFSFLAAAPCASLIGPLALDEQFRKIALELFRLVEDERLTRLKAIAFYDMGSFLDGRKLKGPHEWTDEQCMAVEDYGLSVKHDGCAWIVMHDKVAALEELARITA